MPSRIEMTESNAVDIAKRYDIYVSQANDRKSGVVVFRNAFFRGSKALEKTGRYEMFSDYIEIEQSDGSGVFVRRYSIVYFCDAGTKLTCEPVGRGE